MEHSIEQFLSLLSDEREAVRSESILLLQELACNHIEIQKLLVFVGAFDSLFVIIEEDAPSPRAGGTGTGRYDDEDEEEEDGEASGGGVLACDCLRLLLLLVKDNPSNQVSHEGREIQSETVGQNLSEEDRQ